MNEDEDEDTYLTLCASCNLLMGEWDVTQLVKALDRHAANAGSIPRCGKGFSSLSQLSVQTLFRCPALRVQSHALTSVRTIKILYI